MFYCKTRSQNNHKNDQEYIFTFDLFSPFSPPEFLPDHPLNTPRYKIGAITNIGKYLKLGIDIGYGNHTISTLNTKEGYELFEVRPEFYYILNPFEDVEKYFSIELFYIDHFERLKNETFLSLNENFIEYDTADYMRRKYGAFAKFGVFINFSEKFGANIYTGAGIRYKINNYNNVIKPVVIESFEEDYPPFYRNEGNHFSVDFTFGLKFYYRLIK
ncbi:hypothetical protein LPB138_02095 [Urechidicola croceus]|uniref:Outer membrane protein beta-barrel domain-containing protein n=1 Tax=Urechidicola croceus TaxID=1850246 RepID=A0A1D8P4L5_9FLAO|nr:hypothetical protein LPB138_02095 [Urechidicola croceus]